VQREKTASRRRAAASLAKGAVLAAWAATSWAIVRAPFRPMLHLDGLEPVQMAFAFVTSPSFVDSNIIGATTLTQLKTDIDARRGA
jgi:aryl-alcohol dehydrogenase-like predicted oxidoreductase